MDLAVNQMKENVSRCGSTCDLLQIRVESTDLQISEIRQTIAEMNDKII